MESLFDIHCSIGQTVGSNKVQRGPLGRKRFERHAVHTGSADDKDGPYFCAALMQGTVRGTVKIVRCTLIVIDIDKMSKRETEKMLFMLSESHLEHIIYTTTRHTPESPRYRLVFNPSRTMSIEEYKCVTGQLCEDLAITNPDPASFAPANPMFYPLALAGNIDDAYIEHIEGKPVDVEPYVRAMVNADDGDNFQSHASTNGPLAIPGALNEHVWLSKVLEAYPANGLDYEMWRECGMALYHQTEGRGFEIWYQWSAQNEEMHGRKYGREIMLKKWASFKVDPHARGVTLRSILNKKNASGRSILSVAYKNLVKEIAEPAELNRVRIDIQDDKFIQTADYKGIATAYRSAAKRVSGDDMSIGEAMQLLRSDHAIGGKKSYFHNHYVFSERENQYYNLRTKSPLPLGSMNYMYGDRMPASNSGERKVVHRVLTNASNGYEKPRVIQGLGYEVGGDTLISDGGELYLNQFNPESWPAVERRFDPDDPLDRQIKEMVFKHLKLICNGEAALVRMILQHIGHLRQRPMRRMHFAYAISSLLQGVGKSTLRQLYETVLGVEQVNLVSAENIAEGFNAFTAAPKLMTFIEEFEFDSRREQNRAIKKMKDLITSDTVSLRKMRTDAHRQRTYTAYALFSNDEYVLGHESVGRRWVPIVVDCVNEEQCTRVLGVGLKEFFNNYHRLLVDNKERFVSYFDQISLEGFETERPPETQHKHLFIDNIPAARMLRVIQEIVEENTSFDLTAEVACGNSVAKLVRNHLDFNDSVDSDELKHFNSSQQRILITKALRMLGYQQLLQDSSRVHLPFEEQQRVRLDDVWIKDHQRFGGVKGVERLKQHLKRVKKMREFEAESRQQSNVVTMDGNAYEEI